MMPSTQTQGKLLPISILSVQVTSFVITLIVFCVRFFAFILIVFHFSSSSLDASFIPPSRSPGARPRLIDLGVEAFVEKDVLRGVLSQELEIVACEACGGAGCEACEGSGAKGRRLRAYLISNAVLSL
ncbi:hypothetical protein [Celeribacter baekdonensis]|uniref:hypothetical protein n=1 Tax=Celeribacter baekdonensis TaxID=875171 RepID=UPI0009448786|nr:hypothetical protein [Celeribacter baekdonensis]